MIVLDHGPGAHHRLIEGGFKATDATHALFTHLHYDHCMDYPRLVLQRWDIGADKVPDLRVYGPRSLEAHDRKPVRCRRLLSTTTCVPARSTRQASMSSRRGVVALPRKPPNPIVTEVKPGDTNRR